MAQTAVEWLEEQLITWSDGRFYLPPHLFEQAKRMEKEQIIEAWGNGQKIILDVFEKYSESLNNCAKAYYRENYEGNSQGSFDTTTSPNTHSEK